MLSLMAWTYGRGVALRNYLYDKGILDVHDLGVRTISVGNITLGGTGKTPLVAYIASELANRGEKVCILTRGYRREDESKRVLVSDGEKVLADFATAGDEPVELATKLLGKAIVIADADRVGAAEWARRKFGVTAFVLDDGFQHRKVKRDLDFVCIDATDPFGGGKLMPAGSLREPVGNLARADMVVITRVEQAANILDLGSQLSDVAPDAAVIECQTKLVQLEPLGNKDRPSDPQDLFAFCGLGNPDNFFNFLRHIGLNVLGTRAFPDHHRYTRADVDALEASAHLAGAGALVTTAKDAVKFDARQFSLPCFVAEIAVELSEPLDL